MKNITVNLRRKTTFSAGNTDTAKFISTLVHEIRNPLTNISLSVELLGSVITDDNLKTYLDIISRNTARINDLVKQLLKPQVAGEVNSNKYSIHELLDEVIETEKDRIRLKSISVKKEYAVAGCEVVVDKAKFKIALTNIIINAIDAMTPGTGALTVSTTSIAGITVIKIKDNGCGISKENLKNIYSPYYSNKPGGLGIGLASTYSILNANHVEIDVESEEGTGTCFTLSFLKEGAPQNRNVLPHSLKKIQVAA